MEKKVDDPKKTQSDLNKKNSKKENRPYMSITIEDIELARAGDKESFEKISTAYHRIISYISSGYYLIGGDQDDLIQEGYIGLWNAIRDYDKSKECSFRYFAEKCIKRKILTAIRASTRKKHGPLNYYRSYNKPIYDNSEYTLLDRLKNETVMDPLEVYIYKEEMDDLYEIIELELSKLEKRVYKLHHSGMSYFEISDILKVEEKSVDNALQRAKKKILKTSKFELVKV